MDFRAPFIVALSALCLANPSVAQPLGIQSEFLQDRRERSPDTIRFCLNPESLMVDFDRAVAAALADSLLLSVEFHEMRIDFPAPLDYVIGITDQDLYIALYTECDAVMGYAYPSTQVADWLTVTQPYARTSDVVVTTRTDLSALGDLAPGERIGTRMGARGDGAVLRVELTRAESQRWQRLPYPSNQLLLERLADGTIPVAMVWEPALAAAIAADLVDETAISILASDPVPEPTLDFGIALLSPDTFLRGLLDDAIIDLVASGALNEIIADIDFPAVPAIP